MLYNQLDPNGNVVIEAIELKPYHVLPEGHSWVPFEPNLEAQKAEIIRRIKQHRDQLIVSGGYKVGTKWYHSDTFSRSQQLGLVILGAGIPAGIKWKTMDGSFVDMTQQLATEIFTAAVTQDTLMFNYSEQLIADVKASADPSSISIYSGWPEVYGL